ncbi:MAG: hypothetical protein EBZ00_04890, partial [Actinobacteria bacterium]|nr:hypothetical protein [Actinomycetota bacterium]
MRTFRKSLVTVGVAIAATLSMTSIALAESASGSGATFPQQFLASATAEFNKATGHNVTYANPGGGSSKGKADFKGGLTDFGGSDSAVTSAQAASFDWTYVPYVGGAIAIAYRLDELQGATLSLSANTINAIFAGTITNWSDANIIRDMKANPTWANTKKKVDYKGASVQWTPTGPFAVTATVSILPTALKGAKGKKIEVVDNKAKKTIGTVADRTRVVGDVVRDVRRTALTLIAAAVGSDLCRSTWDARSERVVDCPVRVGAVLHVVAEVVGRTRTVRAIH